MVTSVHTLITEVQDVTRANVAEIKPPVTVPSGEKTKEKSAGKVRSKYRHVAALHSQTRPSCLSHESVESPSFLGFRNLMVLTIIVMNLRLVMENAKKYGLRLTLTSKFRGDDVRTALILYALTPCHLFVAYMIEKVAMENAKGAVGRRKKSDVGINAPETDKDKKDFYNTWWWIAFAHAVNASFALLITSFVVYNYLPRSVALGTISELHAIVVWLKTMSYALTNRDLRHAMLHPTASEADLPEFYAQCPYPRNITLGNLCYFWWAPTLVYQPCYPRSERVRKWFVAKRFGEVIALSVFEWIIAMQYAAPLLYNSIEGMAKFDVPSMAERLMKLGPVSLVLWLGGFFILFHSFLNGLAELVRFGDRQFYEDWWNSTSLRNYWSSWNKPVYHFMRRHIYSPLIGRGLPHNVAVVCVFVFSGILHELAIGIPTQNILGAAFMGMVFQLPLIAMTDPLSKGKGTTGKVIGNCTFWVNFVFVGQPIAVMMYFFAWQSKFGDAAKISSKAG